MKVGQSLKDLRKKKNLTQQVVCKKAKLSQTFLSQIEGGVKEPSPEMLRRLCKFYKIPVQVVVLKSLEEKDVQANKLPAFNKLMPSIAALIDEFFN